MAQFLEEHRRFVSGEFFVVVSGEFFVVVSGIFSGEFLVVSEVVLSVFVFSVELFEFVLSGEFLLEF